LLRQTGSSETGSSQVSQLYAGQTNLSILLNSTIPDCLSPLISKQGMKQTNNKLS